MATYASTQRLCSILKFKLEWGVRIHMMSSSTPAFPLLCSDLSHTQFNAVLRKNCSTFLQIQATSLPFSLPQLLREAAVSPLPRAF